LDKGQLRQIWEENVPFDKKNREKEEIDDIEDHCEHSSYKYYIFFVSGQTYNFQELSDINPYDAVRKYQLIIKYRFHYKIS
jgi:hypothetical protein